VFFISSIVIIYSYSYIKADKNIARFITLVYLFVLSMALIIVRPNIIRILLGWDGLGLVSYALVVYYQNVKSANAGIITILSNRLGDVAILISISWLRNFGGWDFFYVQIIFRHFELNWVLILVLIAGITKRAQIPFSAWLPAAMAAPTPVSSLVHSSTLVTAGVYLIIRFNIVLGMNNFLLLVSVLTLFIAGLGANFEFDFKKIIALSTLRQLGVIIMILSLGIYEFAFFHLISHAIFKSLLFLCAGFYIHSSVDSQDIRLLSKMVFSHPLVNIYFIGCSLSLCGFPFLAGFFSKDLILERYFFLPMNWLVFRIMLLGIFFTITYSVRLIYFVYLNRRGNLICKFYSLDWFILVSISVLFSVSVVVGSWFRCLYVPPVIFLIPLLVKLIVLLVGGILRLILIKNYTLFNSPKRLESYWKVYLKWFLGRIWFLPFLTPLNFIKPLNLGKLHFKIIDLGWLEYFGGQGGVYILSLTSAIVDKWNVTHIKIFLYSAMVILVFVLIIG